MEDITNQEVHGHRTMERMTKKEAHALTALVNGKAVGRAFPYKFPSAADDDESEGDDDEDEDEDQDEHEDEDEDGDGDKESAAVNDGSISAEVGSIGTIKNIYNDNEDEDGRPIWVDTYPSHWQEAAENEETAKYALVVRNEKDFDSRKKSKIHSIIVQSPWLKQALGQEVLKDYPGITCELERLVFDAPFEPFVHRWGELLRFLEKGEGQVDQKTRDHMVLLHGVLKEELKDTIKAFEDYVAYGVITYEHLWVIFQPGDIVVSTHGGTMSAFEFKEGDYVSTTCGDAYKVQCECIDWTGENFGRSNEVMHVYKFKGTRSISSLRAFPLSFHPDKATLRQRLIERGKKFESLAGYHFKAYKGAAIGWDMEGNETSVNVSGRIVIDVHTSNRFSEHSKRYHVDMRSSDIADIIEDDDKYAEKGANDFLINKRKAKVRLGEAQHLICYSKVCGYSLNAKKWLEFFVDLVSDISWNEAAFDSLVLPRDQKDLIMSFSEAQIQNQQTFDDVVEGKGKGIIMLLSGPPGVGKTLTAESVAENMRVPLYMMSAGDLGHGPSDIEYKLASILEIVAAWNAVLLLDECDVFLETRTTSDLERNRLVSIFLRMLEYYEGILFLTTNRRDNIDPAFQSRIHVSIAYPELGTEARRTIWKKFVESSMYGGATVTLADKDYDDLAALPLNGRQIKNVLKTSQLLAMKRGSGQLRREFIDTVLAIERQRPQMVGSSVEVASMEHSGGVGTQRRPSSSTESRNGPEWARTVIAVDSDGDCDCHCH